MPSPSFTGGPGTSSIHGVRLGFATSLPSAPSITVPGVSPTFTGIPGISLAYPANIMPGVAFARLRAGRSFTGNLTFIGLVAAVRRGRLPFGALVGLITQLRSFSLRAVRRTTTQLDTLPAALDVATSENVPINIDVSNYLDTGDSVNAPSATLKLNSTKAIVPSTDWLNDLISSDGNVIQIPINVAALRIGQTYLLTTTFIANLTDQKILTVTTLLNVVS